MHATLAQPLKIAPEPAASAEQPALWRAVVFRFAFVYWLLIVLVVAANEDTGITWFGTLVRPVWNPIVVWVARHVLGISGELITAINGSGDKTADWVGVFLAATTAAIVTLVWSVLTRSTDVARLRSLLRVVLRYTVAFALLGYGTSKLFCLQFPDPGASRLIQTYGDSSPMGLLWTFMGASSAYQFFAGLAETVGAVLLLFRRTTPLGALTLTIVLVNVVLLNFCFDVPVKIDGVHYLGMCIFLLLPQLGRMANVLLFNHTTQPVAPEPISPNRRLRVASRILKYAVIGLMVFQDLQGDLRWLAARNTHTWYDGYWNVTTFSRDGQDVPALITDVTRWRRLRFQTAEQRIYARWRFMDNSPGELYTVVIDEKLHAMTLTRSDLEASKPPSEPVTLRYVQTDPDHLTLDGKLGTATLSVRFERLEADKSLLVSRGFHWINETPFNR